MKPVILKIGVGLLSAFIMYLFLASNPSSYATGLVGKNAKTGICLGVWLLMSNYLLLYAAKDEKNYLFWFVGTVVLLLTTIGLNAI